MHVIFLFFILHIHSFQTLSVVNLLISPELQLHSQRITTETLLYPEAAMWM